MMQIFDSGYFIVYSIPNCPYCSYAKDLLESQGRRYKTVMLSKSRPEELLAFKKTVIQKVGVIKVTFPTIFFVSDDVDSFDVRSESFADDFCKKAYIGGFDALKKAIGE